MKSRQFQFTVQGGEERQLVVEAADCGDWTRLQARLTQLCPHLAGQQLELLHNTGQRLVVRQANTISRFLKHN